MSRRLIPREHGAYGELLLPLAAPLLQAEPSIQALALAAAIVLAFLAQESILILLGARGPNSQRANRERAMQHLAMFGAPAVGLTLFACLNARWETLSALSIPICGGAVVIALTKRGSIKTIAGELLLAAALTSCAIPLSLRMDRPLSVTMGEWSMWFLLFAVATLTVRAVIEGRAVLHHIAMQIGLLAVALSWPLYKVGALTSGMATALSQPLLLSTALWIFPPPPRALSRAGLLIVISGLAALYAIIRL